MPWGRRYSDTVNFVSLIQELTENLPVLEEKLRLGELFPPSGGNYPSSRVPFLCIFLFHLLTVELVRMWSCQALQSIFFILLSDLYLGFRVAGQPWGEPACTPALQSAPGLLGCSMSQPQPLSVFTSLRNESRRNIYRMLWQVTNE